MAAKLISVPGLKNGAASSEKLPTRLKVLNWGRNQSTKGVFVVDERTAKVFAQTQAKMGWDKIALDYEHNTVKGTQAYEDSADPRPVAAHLSCSVVPNDGLYCDVEGWTPSGLENAKNYQDLSPAPLSIEVDGEHVLIGCHSVALTQHGAVAGLEFLSADFGTEMNAKLSALSSSISFAPKKNMNPHMKVLRSFLGSGDGMSDEEVLSCMASEIGSGAITRKGPLDNVGGTSMKVMSADDITAIVAKAIEPLSASVTAMTKAAEDATKDSLKTQRTALIAQATRENKVIPLSAEQIEALPIETLSALVKGLPKSNLATQRSITPVLDPKDKGKIKGGAVATLSINGQTIPITLDAGNGNHRVDPLEKTRNAFQEQAEALQSRQ